MSAIIAFAVGHWRETLIAILAFGWLGDHYISAGRLSHAQGQFKALLAQDAIESAHRDEAARAALEAQIAARNVVEENNARVIQTLQARADTAAADLQRANRLLELAAQDHTGRGQLSETGDQPGTAPAGQAAGANGFAQLLVRTKQECADNADRLDALIAEIRPQL